MWQSKVTADSAVQGCLRGSGELQTYRILKRAVGSFGLDTALLKDGNIPDMKPGSKLLIHCKGPHYRVKGTPDRLSTLLRIEKNSVAAALKTCIPVSARLSNNLTKNLGGLPRSGEWQEVYLKEAKTASYQIFSDSHAAHHLIAFQTVQPLRLEQHSQTEVQSRRLITTFTMNCHTGQPDMDRLFTPDCTHERLCSQMTRGEIK